MRYSGVQPQLILNTREKFTINSNKTIGREQFVFITEADAKKLDENGEPLQMSRKNG